MTILRDQLLAGRAIALAGRDLGGLQAALEGLGARVEVVPEGDDLAADDEATGQWAQARAPLDALVYDAAAAFAAGGQADLLAAMERGWVAIRETANGALIPADGPAQVVLVGPRPDAGPLAGAARAALENLARTLSVEWARYRVTAAMIAPGTGTTAAQLAELVCFLVSPAGAYFSGCRLDLGAVPSPGS
jgi:NAD(P)-dependent dehydrogenase (short-subunit alcohol dehydrogenase family)